jgi:hypothetical protein
VSPISRTQAYAKVITLMVDRTLPAPTSIGVSSEPVLTFDTADDVAAWATALGAAMHSYSAHNGITQHSASGDHTGLRILAVAYVRTPKPELITEDMSRVRAVAEERPDPDPEREETLRVEEDAAEGDSYRREAEAEYEAERTEEPTGLDEGGPVPDFAAALSAMSEDPQYREHPREVGYDPDPIRPMNDTVSLDDDVNDDEPAVTR